MAWMIAMQLPDMTGLELQQLLRRRLTKTPLIMVDSEYDAARELSVLAVGHPYYACKPLDGSWVEKLRSNIRLGTTNRIDPRANPLGGDSRAFKDEFNRLSEED